MHRRRYDRADLVIWSVDHSPSSAEGGCSLRLILLPHISSISGHSQALSVKVWINFYSSIICGVKLEVDMEFLDYKWRPEQWKLGNFLRRANPVLPRRTFISLVIRWSQSLLLTVARHYIIGFTFIFFIILDPLLPAVLPRPTLDQKCRTILICELWGLVEDDESINIAIIWLTSLFHFFNCNETSFST